MSSSKIAPSGGSFSRTSSVQKVNRRASYMEIDPVLLRRTVEDEKFTSIMTALTLFALFGDDFRLAVTEKGADSFFYAVSCIALVFFFGELVVNSLYKPGYRFGFYFTLDFLATFSLIPDIGWIWDIITGVEDQSQGGTEALKAGRASRAGTRAGRIVRVIRIIRMVRIVKLYKMTKGEKTDGIEEEMKSNPSMVGKKLTELTTRRVITLVLLMLLVFPAFDGVYDETVNDYQISGFEHLHRSLQLLNSSSSNASQYSLENSVFVKRTVEEYATLAGPLFYLQLHGVREQVSMEWLKNLRFMSKDDPTAAASPPETNPLNGWTAAQLWGTPITRDSYRSTEAITVAARGCYSAGGAGLLKVEGTENQCSSIAYFNNKEAAQLEAGLNILKTCFVMLVLGAGVVMFTRDAEKLVIIPIERMVKLVKKLAENPLASTVTEGPQLEEDKELAAGNYETAVLEKTLSKIGGLLQVGFGEAGAEIIGKNMGSGGALDPMIPGKKITAIFGFCDIRQFTDTTECLQEEVMVYVNKIGDIVHTCTHEYYGAANKNIGDAFLLAWKICNGDIPAGGEYLVPTVSGRHITPSEMADSALAAFLRVIVELDNANTHGPLSAYLKHAAVVKRFGPDFRIKLGFGLHVGWSIEGAIGSRYKIDASYLSPNVNMAARLEAATKQFRTPLLLSHWFRDLLSVGAQRLCRRIDCVMVKGSEVPMTLYTYDVENMVPDFAKPKFDANNVRLPVDFANDPQFEELRAGIPEVFFNTFDVAVAAYLDGNWQESREGLEKSLKIRPGDGPAVSLMEVLQEANFTAPEGWTGSRALTEK